ncbi:MAG: hypothetical protein KGQ40_05005 [Rhodospirillales bacterium]|nr:hypothetical protein [Rhodospirillales bacterium]
MELNESVNALLANQSAPHPFMQKFCATLGLPASAFGDFVRGLQTNFEASIIASRRSPQTLAEIPPYTHRIWLTGNEEPSLPPDDYLDNYLRACKALPSDAGHFFWTNSPAVAAHIHQKAAAHACRNIYLMSPAVFAGDPLLASITRLMADRKFVLAADMLKFVILHRFGGIYSDLGIVYDEPTFDLIRVADYGFVVSDGVFFQSSFFACPPASELTAMFLAVMNHPGAFDPSFALLGRTAGALDELHIFAGFGLTACTMLFLPPSARAVMIPANTSHMQWRSQQSWYGAAPKHGNVLVANTGPSIISADEFTRADALEASCLRVYGNQPRLQAQLRAALVTQPYFANNPTLFCRTFFYHGSDKAMGWHNYGYLYNFLLPPIVGCARSILEIGIGTNNLDVPSTMGVTGVPGASLRAWKELFPQATVIGADVDVRILFQEEGIETYWVDQTRPDAVRSLFDMIGDRKFDLIIDDGLHTFAANRTLLDGAYAHVHSNGLYVIEDVANGDIAAWEEYLAGVGHEAALIRLPHASNASDNCLILIPGGQAR